MKEKHRFIRKFIPDRCVTSVFEIEYDRLYEEGKRFLLLDVDNTLISYEDRLPSNDLLDLRKLWEKIGFSIYLISNNNGRRIAAFAMAFEAEGFVGSAKKPLKIGFKKSLRQMNCVEKKEVVVIGDQLMTDVFGAKRMGLDCILVKPLMQKTEKWFTKINRCLERKVLNKMKDSFPESYREIIHLKRD